jgi:O-succinylbenzoate synthase
MALFDRELRRGGESLASRWPALMSTPLQATTSILGSEMEVEVPTETVRLRVKTQPGSIATGVVTFLERLGQPVLLDFNCSATLDDEVLEQVAMLSTRIEVVGVEQPYAPGNVVDHARLAEQLNVPVSIDEGVRTVRDIEQIARYGAAKIVCVKPARVGGYANARTIIERAKELGLRPYIGGFFESELARSVNRTMAHHLVDEPSDVGPVATSALDADTEFLKVLGGFGLVPTSEFLAKCVLVETLSI